jgi:hypothetical protein
VRFAVGIEDADDIIRDFENALAGIPDRKLEREWEHRFRA